MRIEGDRVGELDTGQASASAVGELERAAVGAVDVQPQPLGRAQLGDLSQRVDRAGVGGAGVGDDAERLPPFPTVVPDEGRQYGDVEALRPVVGDHAHGAGGETGQRAAFATDWWAWSVV